MTTFLEVSCRDPIVSRDGRPFGKEKGNRMRGLSWPLPSVVAGSLRTLLGKAAGREFATDVARELLQVAVAGLFPVVDQQHQQLYLPAPNDCVIEAREEYGSNAVRIHRVRPLPSEPGDGADWPADGLRPVMLSEAQAAADFKPKAGPAWWPIARYAEWLAGAETMNFDDTFLNAPALEERTHVELDAQSGAASEGELFTTAALPLTHLPRYGAEAGASFGQRWAEVTLAARVTADGWCGEAAGKLNDLHPLGGERRLAHWRRTEGDPWTCPQTISAALKNAEQVRMVLATPAIFRDGWKPGWLNGELTGTPPGSNVTLTLVGLTVQHWRAVSGWSYQPHPETGKPGPKPVKRMVPAGGVYFFKKINGDSATLTKCWLHSVSDDAQDQWDGFGLAAWGIW